MEHAGGRDRPIDVAMILGAAMDESVDAVIVGAGVAGSSLARHLATGRQAVDSVLVLDDGTAPVGREWAYWSRGGRPLDGAAHTSFARVRVHAGGLARDVRLGEYRYRVLRERDLRRITRDVLDARPGFRFERARVVAVVDGTGGAHVRTEDGRRIHARWVFDSVGGPLGRPAALLRFAGWEVRCEADAFDVATPTLCDFRVPCGPAGAFAYVLPRSRGAALVEVTSFAGEVPDDAPSAYLRGVLGLDAFELIRRESGTLPLRPRQRRRRGRHVLAIGAAGGLLRASTGYGVERIERDCAAIAGSLERHGHPFALGRSGGRQRWLDGVFLRAVAARPQVLEDAFAALFAVEVLIHTGVSVGLLPITGLSLPLVSHGGSGLLAHAIAVGLLLNVGLRPGYEMSNEPFRYVASR
jgi:lycopene beta-cyclase